MTFKVFIMKNILLLLAIYCCSVNTNAQKCTSGDCKNGIGTYVLSNGDTYTGNFKDGDRDGKGTYTWLAGDVYVGEFSANEQTGYGVLNFSDGKKCVGQFDNGVFEGEGLFTLAKGCYSKGIFKNSVGFNVKYYNANNVEISKNEYIDAVIKEAFKSK